MKVIITTNTDLHFAFEEYCELMFGVVPQEDIVGLAEIKFVDSYSNARTDKGFLGCYLRCTNGQNASIEINIPNILKEKIDEFNFSRYPEVAALLLSHVVFHEIGHHAHTFKRHGVKKAKIEDFAEKYTAACYYRYLLSRKPKILAEYRRGLWNILEMNKDGRASARKSRSNILAWLEEHKQGVPFP